MSKKTFVNAEPSREALLHHAMLKTLCTFDAQFEADSSCSEERLPKGFRFGQTVFFMKYAGRERNRHRISRGTVVDSASKSSKDERIHVQFGSGCWDVCVRNLTDRKPLCKDKGSPKHSALQRKRHDMKSNMR